jgi:hypothetical protein
VTSSNPNGNAGQRLLQQNEMLDIIDDLKDPVGSPVTSDPDTPE